MSYYTLYDPATGQIVATTYATNPADLELGQNYIEGQYDGSKYYIDNGQAVPITVQPVKYLTKYVFNWQTKQWEVDIDQTSNLVKMQRNRLLNQNVDTFNPIRYASLTTEQQQELATYRQALLDVPTQSGFPMDIVWPTPPDFV